MGLVAEIACTCSVHFLTFFLLFFLSLNKHSCCSGRPQIKLLTSIFPVLELQVCSTLYWCAYIYLFFCNDKCYCILTLVPICPWLDQRNTANFFLCFSRALSWLAHLEISCKFLRNVYQTWWCLMREREVLALSGWYDFYLLFLPY